MTQHPHHMAQQLQELCPELVEHIARCTEQAYRRGYQQGAIYGKDHASQIVEWRFSSPDGLDWTNDSPSARYNQAVAPPGSPHPDYSTSAVERLSFEAGNCSNIISALSHID